MARDVGVGLPELHQEVRHVLSRRTPRLWTPLTWLCYTRRTGLAHAVDGEAGRLAPLAVVLLLRPAPHLSRRIAPEPHIVTNPFDYHTKTSDGVTNMDGSTKIYFKNEDISAMQIFF